MNLSGRRDSGSSSLSCPETSSSNGPPPPPLQRRVTFLCHISSCFKVPRATKGKVMIVLEGDRRGLMLERQQEHQHGSLKNNKRFCWQGNTTQTPAVQPKARVCGHVLTFEYSVFYFCVVDFDAAFSSLFSLLHSFAGRAFFVKS